MGQVEAVAGTTFEEYARLIQERCVRDGLIFRGQASSEWSLLPKIARLHPRGSLVKTERQMFEEFQRRARPHLRELPRSDWEWLAIAQHYGTATRLLDWTTNVLGALWFAVKHEADGRNDLTGSGAVWVYEPDETEVVKIGRRSSLDSPFSGTKTRVYYPPFVSERIAAQSGVFTVHKRLKNTFVPLEKMHDRKGRLLKIVIPRKSFSALRYYLEWCGVNAASMFPGLEGVGKHAQWLHSYAGDEHAPGSRSRGVGVQRRRSPRRG